MNRLSEIQVEPLSDQRWSAIEQALFARVELEKPLSGSPVDGQRRTGIRPWLLVAALIGVVCGLAFTSLRRPLDAVVDQPSRITTGAEASRLALQGLSLDVEPESAVVVGAETKQGLLIVVDRGSITCDVAPREPGAPLIVQAGATRVRVLGTRFTVKRIGETARVKVQEGVVEVSAGGQLLQVRAGEEWPMAVVAHEPHTPGLGTALGAPAGSVGRVSPTQERRPALASKPRNPPASTAPITERGHAPLDSPAPSPQELFERATALERDDPRRAGELYALLESGGDSWAQNALYAHGRLEASRGNEAHARRLLERYLTRFPSGKNAEDARAVLKKIR